MSSHISSSHISSSHISSSHISSNATNYSSTISDRDGRYKHLASKIRGNVLGPMPVNTFFQVFAFAKGSEMKPPSLKKKGHGESSMYKSLKDYADGLNTDLTFEDTSHRMPPVENKLYPDVSVFRNNDDVKSFTTMEFFIEFKSKDSDDPFDDDDAQFGRWKSENDRATAVRGQVASYCAAILGLQFRLHMFCVLIFGNYARLMRWDRSVAIISERFVYTESPHLSKFLLSYASMSSVEQGHDPTVEDVTHTNLNLDKAILEKLMQDCHKILRVTVPNQEGNAETSSYLFSSSIMRNCTSPFGRATRGIEAYDVVKKKYVFVKDGWRSSELLKEGDVYKQLKEHGVTNIPQFDQGNDLGFTTITSVDDAYWKDRLSSHPTRQYYRMSLNEVLKSLHQFQSTKEFVSAVADAMHAHDLAYFNAKILHRDISAGNIMIGSTGGVLIDWDLSSEVPTVEGPESSEVPTIEDPESRKPRGTGTWQFMSVKLCMGGLDQDIEDDRESAFWVILYMALRFSKHNQVDPDDTTILRKVMRIFDDVDPDGRGGRLKSHYLSLGSPDIRFTDRPQLDALIEELRETFAMRYANIRTIPAVLRVAWQKEQEKAMKKIRSEGWLVATIKGYLDKDGWPASDVAEQNSLGDGAVRKRKQQDEELRMRIMYANSKLRKRS